MDDGEKHYEKSQKEVSGLNLTISNLKEYIEANGMTEFIENKSSKTEGSSTKYQIVVTTLIRKTINLEVDGSDTVEQIKENIQNETGIQSSDEQQIQFKNKKIEKGRKISEYNIQNGSTIHMLDNLMPRKIIKRSSGLSSNNVNISYYLLNIVLTFFRRDVKLTIHPLTRHWHHAKVRTNTIRGNFLSLSKH